MKDNLPPRVLAKGVLHIQNTESGVRVTPDDNLKFLPESYLQKVASQIDLGQRQEAFVNFSYMNKNQDGSRVADKVIVPLEREVLEKQNGVWQQKETAQEKYLREYPHPTGRTQNDYAELLEGLQTIRDEPLQGTPSAPKYYPYIPQEITPQKIEPEAEETDERTRSVKIIFLAFVVLALASYFAGFWSFGVCFPMGGGMQFCF